MKFVSVLKVLNTVTVCLNSIQIISVVTVVITGVAVIDPLTRKMTLIMGTVTDDVI
jgi:hypothetical protein